MPLTTLGVHSLPAADRRPRVVFMGTPAFAVPTLEALLGAIAPPAGAGDDASAPAPLVDVVAVFTQPDRPAGRGRRVAPSPVKARASDAGVPVFQPPSLRRGPAAEAALAALADLAPDLVVVAAYGLLLPPVVLDRPPFGALNVHASLLPRWRGASPIQRAILAGDPETGVTIMRMDEGLDTGPIVAKAATPIGPRETAAELTDRLAAMGARLLVDTLPGWFAGTAAATPQDDAAATLAPRLTRDDGRLDAAEGAAALERRVRAMQPWPGAWLPLADGSVLKVMRAEVVDGPSDEPSPMSSTPPASPTSPTSSETHRSHMSPEAHRSNPPANAPSMPASGLAVDRGWPVLWTADGGLRLRVVQPAGKGPMDGDAFVRGRPDAIASRAATR